MRCVSTVICVAGAWLASCVLPCGVVCAEEAGDIPAPRITFHRDSEGVRGVKLRLFVKNDPDMLWALVTDSKRAPTLFKNVSSITASSRGSGYSDYHLSSSIGERVVTCLVKRDNSKRHISWKRVGGALVELYGYFKIGQSAQYPQHVRLEYGSFVDPGGIARVLMTDRRRRSAVRHMISKLQALQM